jgi:hypothetical protein
MDNEEWAYRALREAAQDAVSDTDPDDEDTFGEEHYGAAVYQVRDGLREWVEENWDLPVSGFAADLVGAALSEVNWYEIAEALVDDLELEWSK